MAAHTIGGAQGIVVADVAGSAGSRRRRHVRADQGKTRDAVVELRSQPIVCRVAGLAGTGKIRARVIGIRRGLKVLEVAGDALRRKT